MDMSRRRVECERPIALRSGLGKTRTKRRIMQRLRGLWKLEQWATRPHKRRYLKVLATGEPFRYEGNCNLKIRTEDVMRTSD